MATVSEIRGSGTSLTAISYPILEPLNAPGSFRSTLGRFGEHYNLSNDSHLYRFLVSLCGDVGAGSLKKELLLPRLQARLESTEFLNLDRLYGDGLALPRLSSEIYGVDPNNEILTQAQWADVRAKDAAYRERCLTWMRAIIEGPTLKGMSLAGEAATGVECEVFERYKYVENAASDDPTTIPNIGQTSSRNEFVIIPRTPTLTQQEYRRIMRLTDKLKPVNTLQTVATGLVLRNSRPVTTTASSSDRFQVNRFVTGRPDIDWPEVDPLQGFWVTIDENEAPTYAYMDRQESVTYLSVDNVTSTSEQFGPFNKEQRGLFSHLASTPTDDYFYADDRAYAKNIAPINIAKTWVTTNEQSQAGHIVVNNYYPIGYFTETNAGFISEPPEQFWASIEKLAPESEELIFDFGRVRPFNFIDFEVCQKPIDFTIEYDDAGTWTPVEIREDFPTTLAADYLPSLENPWYYFEAHVDLVETQKIRITFTRRDVPFPLETTEAFPWSIEVRGARLMHVVAHVDDFIADSGADILGNTYRTEIDVSDPAAVTDGNSTTFWQSQPNPTRQAVEALYFDMRTGPVPGTMAFLDLHTMGELDERSMADLETYLEDGAVVDEIFIDPVTFGPDMHFYYSNDTQPDWDKKLWTPIPRHYTLKKGYHSLPGPTLLKFFKIEFSNLAAAPYQPVEYPTLPTVSYRRFPAWVQHYFNDLGPTKPQTLDETVQVDILDIDPLSLFKQETNAFSSSLEDVRAKQAEDNEAEIKSFIEEFFATQVIREPQEQVEDQINFNSPVMWQRDLLQQLDSSTVLSRIVQQNRNGFNDTGFNAELGLPVYLPPTQQSVEDLEDAAKEKQHPIMWFPRRVRHGYQIVEAPFNSKLAYFVAIKTVSFHRRNYSVQFDEASYMETLEDTDNIDSTDFVQDDWRFVVTP